MNAQFEGLSVLISMLVGLVTLIGTVCSVVWCIASIKSATALLRRDIGGLTEAIEDLAASAKSNTETIAKHDTRISVIESRQSRQQRGRRG